MTTPKLEAIARACDHNFILITRSTTRPTPHRKCSRCGEIRSDNTILEGE